MNVDELKDLENSNLNQYKNPAQLRKLLRQVVNEWESLESRNRSLMDEFERMKVTYVSPKGSVKEALEVFSRLEPQARKDVWGAEIDKIMEAQRLQLSTISQLAETARQTLLTLQMIREKHPDCISDEEWQDALEQVKALSWKEAELQKTINLEPTLPQNSVEEEQSSELDDLFD